MLKLGHLALFAALLLASATPASAQCLCEFFHVLKRDFVRNNSWPEPFVQPDRQIVNMTNEVMIAKGWERQNLLSRDYFKPDNTSLNVAGEERIRYILTSVPVQHRMIYVERGLTPQVTNSRVRAVQRTASGLLPQGSHVDIVETNTVNYGSPADQRDIMNRKILANVPDPKLPAIKDDNGGGGGGGGGN